MDDSHITINVNEEDLANLSPEEREDVEKVLKKFKEDILHAAQEEERKEASMSAADKLLQKKVRTIDSYSQGKITLDELFEIADELPTEADREEFKRKLFSYGIKQSDHKLFEKLDYDEAISSIYINDLLREAIENHRLRTAQFIIEKSLNKDSVKIDESFGELVASCIDTYEFGLLSYLLESPTNPRRQQFHDAYDFKDSLDKIYNEKALSPSHDFTTKFCYLLLNHGAFLKDEHCKKIQDNTKDPVLLRASQVDEKVREEISNIMYGRNCSVPNDFAVQCMLNSDIQDLITSGAELEFEEVLDKMNESSSVRKKSTSR